MNKETRNLEENGGGIEILVIPIAVLFAVTGGRFSRQAFKNVARGPAERSGTCTAMTSRPLKTQLVFRLNICKISVCFSASTCAPMLSARFCSMP